MDKSTFQNFISCEHDSLIDSIDLFRTLLPDSERDASVHSGEEGTFIELVLTQYLKEKLPNGIGIGGGFVVDFEQEWNSKQIDILIYDAVKYAPIMKYGDAVVLPVEAVIGAISVKRKLYKQQLENEIASLTDIGSHAGGRGYPKPYLSIVAFHYEKTDIIKAKTDIYSAISAYYASRIDVKNRTHKFSWNELIDSVIIFDKLIVKGKNFLEYKLKPGRSDYLWTGGNTFKRSLYVQHLLNGIHRAWYDAKRGNKRAGKLLAIPEGGMQVAGAIEFIMHDRGYVWDKFIPKPPIKHSTLAPELQLARSNFLKVLNAVQRSLNATPSAGTLSSVTN